MEVWQLVNENSYVGRSEMVVDICTVRSLQLTEGSKINFEVVKMDNLRPSLEV